MPDDKVIAKLNVSIYNDKVELSMRGDEIRIGGALVTIMLRNPYFYHIFDNAVEAAEREISRQHSQSAYHQLMTLNLN